MCFKYLEWIKHCCCCCYYLGLLLTSRAIWENYVGFRFYLRTMTKTYRFYVACYKFFCRSMFTPACEPPYLLFRIWKKHYGKQTCFNKPLARSNDVSDPMTCSSIRSRFSDRMICCNDMKSADPITWNERSDRMTYDPIKWSPIQWHEVWSYDVKCINN